MIKTRLIDNLKIISLLIQTKNMSMARFSFHKFSELKFIQERFHLVQVQKFKYNFSSASNKYSDEIYTIFRHLLTDKNSAK